MSTTGHTIRALTDRELTKLAAISWMSCQTSAPCDRDARYQATWKSSSRKSCKARLCSVHANEFAARHYLTLPVVVVTAQRPTDHVTPLPASVVARGASTQGTQTATDSAGRRNRGLR